MMKVKIALHRYLSIHCTLKYITVTHNLYNLHVKVSHHFVYEVCAVVTRTESVCECCNTEAKFTSTPLFIEIPLNGKEDCRNTKISEKPLLSLSVTRVGGVFFFYVTTIMRKKK